MHWWSYCTVGYYWDFTDDATSLYWRDFLLTRLTGLDALTVFEWFDCLTRLDWHSLRIDASSLHWRLIDVRNWVDCCRHVDWAERTWRLYSYEFMLGGCKTFITLIAIGHIPHTRTRSHPNSEVNVWRGPPVLALETDRKHETANRFFTSGKLCDHLRRACALYWMMAASQTSLCTTSNDGRISYEPVRWFEWWQYFRRGTAHYVEWW